MSFHCGHGACLELRQSLGRSQGHAVDAVYHHSHLRQVELQGGVAQQRILQLVLRLVGARLYKVVLGQALRLAYSDIGAVLRGEQGLKVGTVDSPVAVYPHRSRCSVECHRTAVAVEHRRLADVLLLRVEGHDVARRRYPQRQVGVAESGKVGQREHTLMRYLVGTSVSAVVHYQRAGALLLLYYLGHVGICVSGRRRYTGVCVPHDALYLNGRIDALNHLCHFVGIAHVLVVVAVVAHKHHHVLPAAGIFVLGVAYGLVNHYLCFFCGAHGEASHSHVELVCLRIAALAVV